MNTASDLIERTFSEGFEIELKENQLHIKNGQMLITEIQSSLAENRQSLIDALQRDIQAKEIGLLIGISGLLYTWTVSRYSNVYVDLNMENEWVAWRETYTPGRKESISHRLISREESFNDLLSELKRYMDYVGNFRRDRDGR